MKIALYTDTHLGVRQDSLNYHSYFEKFYTNIFFPTLRKRDIDTIIHLGDVNDRRKYCNYNSLFLANDYFFEPLKKYNVHMLVGNHDAYNKNTNDINSVELLTKHLPNISVYKNPTEINFDGLNVLMLPWICTDNYTDSINLINNTEAKVVFGHLDIQEFQMNGGRVSDIGFKPSDFDKFHLVMSGHYHHKSQKNNIIYLGNPYQLTWEDYGDIRGFHIFDTSDQSLEFIENPYTIFAKLFYDDSKDIEINYNQYNNKYVKLIIINKTNYTKFEKTIEKLYSAGVYDVKIVESVIDISSNVNSEIIEIEDTFTLIKNYIESMDNIKCNLSKLQNKFIQLYNEAVNLEV